LLHFAQVEQRIFWPAATDSFPLPTPKWAWHGHENGTYSAHFTDADP